MLEIGQFPDNNAYKQGKEIAQAHRVNLKTVKK